VSITRDDWGIAHVHGHTDAQAVFGMIYAQAEDDFNRIEINYLTALGRLSEAEGEKSLMQDLRARLYVDPADLQARYAQSPAWLQQLMIAWADGLNFYLATHPQTHPKVLRHFEPWMALSFTEGSIGGDIEDIALPDLAHFYGWTKAAALVRSSSDPTGSNGIAIAPQNTTTHHALLLINPHTSFYFRSELQMTSDAGLNAYGAATWGQFFLYQGFNARLGWMHTSSHSDAIDQFVETIVRKDGKIFYRYGDALRPVQSTTITIAYRNASDVLAHNVYDLPNPSRPHRGCNRRRPLDRRGDHVRAGARARTILRADQGDRLYSLHEGDGAKGQHLQQHRLCRFRRPHRLYASAIHPPSRRPVRLYQTGRRRRSAHRLAWSACAERRPPSA
jgi:acyl-homoserine-lactone acylase